MDTQSLSEQSHAELLITGAWNVLSHAVYLEHKTRVWRTIEVNNASIRVEEVNAYVPGTKRDRPPQLIGDDALGDGDRRDGCRLCAGDRDTVSSRQRMVVPSLLPMALRPSLFVCTRPRRRLRHATVPTMQATHGSFEIPSTSEN